MKFRFWIVSTKECERCSRIGCFHAERHCNTDYIRRDDLTVTQAVCVPLKLPSRSSIPPFVVLEIGDDGCWARSLLQHSGNGMKCGFFSICLAMATKLNAKLKDLRQSHWEDSGWKNTKRRTVRDRNDVRSKPLWNMDFLNTYIALQNRFKMLKKKTPYDENFMWNTLKANPIFFPLRFATGCFGVDVFLHFWWRWRFCQLTRKY